MQKPIDRVWLLTWTTYGTWLPGDDRGFVSNVQSLAGGPGRRHNMPGSEAEQKQRGLVFMAREKLVGQPIYLDRELSGFLLAQFEETARHRGWTLLAVAIMANHVHVVVGVLGHPEPDTLLRDFKSYASRVLTKRRGKPASGTWWTEGGSKRKKPKCGRQSSTCGIRSTRC